MPFKKSLKKIQKNHQEAYQALRVIKQHYPHLKTFTHDEILRYYHVSSLGMLQTHIQRIQKRALQEHHSKQEDDVCRCQDRYGTFKYLYTSLTLLKQQQAYWYEKEKITLKSYPCPYQKGWHLTQLG